MTNTDNIVDNFGNKSNGYQIMSNQERLFSRIFTIPNLKTRFMYAIKLMEAGQLTMWMQHTTMLPYVANVIVVIDIGSGMPAWASELETYRMRNRLNCARNAYFLGKNIFFHPQYSKTRSKSGHSLVICRFLDKEASLLLLTDLFIVRHLTHP